MLLYALGGSPLRRPADWRAPGVPALVSDAVQRVAGGRPAVDRLAFRPGRRGSWRPGEDLLQADDLRRGRIRSEQGEPSGMAPGVAGVHACIACRPGKGQRG